MRPHWNVRRKAPEPVTVGASFRQRDTKDQPTTYISLLNFSNEQKIIFRNIHSGKKINVRSETFQLSDFHEVETQARAALVSKWE